MPIQSPYWAEFLSCPICCIKFSVNEHRPISLGCGHTFCHECLTTLNKQQCPFDQSITPNDIVDLPVNYALLQLVLNGNVEKELLNILELDFNSKSESIRSLSTDDLECYRTALKCLDNMALYLRPSQLKSSISSLLSLSIQRKLVYLISCQLLLEEGRIRALRAARSLAERVVTELILQFQNPQQLSSNLWAAVRSRGCQFLGPAMQEEVLKLVLLALEDGSSLSRKVLVMFVVQRLEPHFPQASKTSIGHVVQLLYRASCFRVSKRDGDSSLMQLKEGFCTYDALRREHDAQIVQIAIEAGLRIAPDQWSLLLYGDTAHKAHMQSIVRKLQTPSSFAQSVQELLIALQRSGDSSNLSDLQMCLNYLAELIPGTENFVPTWQTIKKVIEATNKVITKLVEFIQRHGCRKLQECSLNVGNSTPKYKVSFCHYLSARGVCPRGSNCTFAHSEEELERYRAKGRRNTKNSTTQNISETLPNLSVNKSQNISCTSSPPSILKSNKQSFSNDFRHFCQIRPNSTISSSESERIHSNNNFPTKISSENVFVPPYPQSPAAKSVKPLDTTQLFLPLCMSTSAEFLDQPNTFSAGQHISAAFKITTNKACDNNSVCKLNNSEKDTQIVSNFPENSESKLWTPSNINLKHYQQLQPNHVIAYNAESSILGIGKIVNPSSQFVSYSQSDEQQNCYFKEILPNGKFLQKYSKNEEYSECNSGRENDFTLQLYNNYQRLVTATSSMPFELENERENLEDINFGQKMSAFKDRGVFVRSDSILDSDAGPYEDSSNSSLGNKYGPIRPMFKGFSKDSTINNNFKNASDVHVPFSQPKNNIKQEYFNYSVFPSNVATDNNVLRLRDVTQNEFLRNLSMHKLILTEPELSHKNSVLNNLNTEKEEPLEKNKIVKNQLTNDNFMNKELNKNYNMEEIKKSEIIETAFDWKASNPTKTHSIECSDTTAPQNDDKSFQNCELRHADGLRDEDCHKTYIQHKIMQEIELQPAEIVDKVWEEPADDNVVKLK